MKAWSFTIFGIALLCSAPAFAASDWTGPYLGVSGGYAWGKSVSHDIDGYNAYGPAGDVSYHPKGLQGNIYGGYNWQRSQYVFGVEGELGYLGISKSQQYPPYVGVRGADDSVAKTSNGVYGEIAGRVGYAINKALLFGKVGFAYTTIQNSFIDSNVTGDTLVANTKTDDRYGLALGVGAEYRLSQRWVARLEYAYYDFGTATHTAIDPQGYQWQFNHDLSFSSVRVGVSYKF